MERYHCFMKALFFTIANLVLTEIGLADDMTTRIDVYADEIVSKDPNYYISKRGQAQNLCEHRDVKGIELYEQFYRTIPVGVREGMIFFRGTGGYTKKQVGELSLPPWNWYYNTVEGRECKKLVDNYLKYTSVKLQYDGLKAIIKSDTFDIKTVIPYERVDSDPYSRKNSDIHWKDYSTSIDLDLLPHIPGFAKDLADSDSDYTINRRKEFISLIENENPEFIIKFILYVAFGPDGGIRLPKDYRYETEFINGRGYVFASKELIATSPKWFTAYNTVLYMACQRANEYSPVHQKGCPGPRR